MREIKATSKCEYPDCDKKATGTVYSRNLEKVIVCCAVHTTVAQDERTPEYFHTCENCGCNLPIN